MRTPNPAKSAFSLRCAAGGRAIAAAGVLRKPGRGGSMLVCDLCQRRPGGSFFAAGLVTHCLLDHPVLHEDSPRVGWVRGPTCAAGRGAAWASLAAGATWPHDAGAAPLPAELAAADQHRFP